MGANVDRRGTESVMQGFELYGVPCFSVWQGSGKTQQLKFAYPGDNLDEALALLEQNLQALEDSGTAATYTLKAHSGPDQDGYISNGTKYIGSFNFCMRNENAPARQHYQDIGGGRVPGIPYALQKKLEELDEKLAALQTPAPADDDEEDDVIVRRIGAVGDVLQENPGLMDIVSGLASKFLGINIPQGAMHGMGRVQDDDDDDEPIDVEGLDEMDALILQLRGYDPKLEQHLGKLLKIAQTNPAQFKMLLGMLDNF